MMWPAMLIGYGGLNLPHDVPANEYLNSSGRKFSKSRGNAIFINKMLEKYQSDAWRYVLTAIAPETADADFTWDDFLERVKIVGNSSKLHDLSRSRSRLHIPAQTPAARIQTPKTGRYNNYSQPSCVILPHPAF